MKALLTLTFALTLISFSNFSFAKSATTFESLETLTISMEEDFPMAGGFYRDSLFWVVINAGPLTRTVQFQMITPETVTQSARINGAIKTTSFGSDFEGTISGKFNGSRLIIDRPVYVGTSRKDERLYLAPGQYMIKGSRIRIPLMEGK